MEVVPHLVLAVLVQLLVRQLSGSWLAGALAATAWVVSREITQAEYRWIELYGSGLRENMPWWGALDLRVWRRLDPWLDWLLPTILVWSLASVARRAARRTPTER